MFIFHRLLFYLLEEKKMGVTKLIFFQESQIYSPPPQILRIHVIQYKTLWSVLFMPPKELWEAYSNRTVRPSRFMSGAYLLYPLR